MSAFSFTTSNTVIGASGIIGVVPWHYTGRRILRQARRMLAARCTSYVAAYCNVRRLLLVHIYYNRSDFFFQMLLDVRRLQVAVSSTD